MNTKNNEEACPVSCKHRSSAVHLTAYTSTPQHYCDHFQIVLLSCLNTIAPHRCVDCSREGVPQ
jgi:hypothetical protein